MLPEVEARAHVPQGTGGPRRPPRASSNTLWELAGPKLFRRLFAAALGDNGPELSDPEAIENYRPDPVHNSTKLVPRGIKVSCCDPCRPSQKPHVERVHVELRRIFEKGAPFDSLSQGHVNLAMSHINSLTRDTLGGKCAYDAFAEEFGEDGRKLLDALGLRRIPASQVTLHPFLLGERFQRVADKAILKKNGITSKKPEAGTQKRLPFEGREQPDVGENPKIHSDPGHGALYQNPGLPKSEMRKIPKFFAACQTGRYRPCDKNRAKRHATGNT